MRSSRHGLAFRYLMMSGLAVVLIAASIAVPIFLDGRANNSPVGVDAFAQQQSATEDASNASSAPTVVPPLTPIAIVCAPLGTAATGSAPRPGCALPTGTATATPMPTHTPVPPTETPVPPTATATRVPAGRMIALGVNPGNPNRANKISQIDQYIAQVGTAPKVIHYYLSWSDGGPFDPVLNDAIVARGATPMLTWNPQDWRYGVTQPAYSDAAIAGGAYDSLLQEWGRDLAAWGKPFYLRVGDEMNGDWNSWSPGKNGNTVETYIAMWRHVVTTMRAAGHGLPKVRFVWCPATVDQGAADFVPMYPGDAYVDWVGLDGFNWGTGTPDHHIGWQSFAQIFQQGYARITALTTKPLMIAEIGSVEQGGNKAVWLKQTFLWDIPTRYPRVKAVLYFNSDGTPDGEGNWLVDTSPTALAAWQRIATDPRYQGRLP